MASSRRDIPGLVRACAVAAVAAACACALAWACAAPQAAWGYASLDEVGKDPVSVVSVEAGVLGMGSADAVEGGEASLSLPRVCPVAVTAVCDPASIEVGVDCGMVDMCGIEPCLCGSADAWGGCSCNGLEEALPAVTYTSSDEGVVQVRQAFGRTWLVPVGEGTATVTAEASLRYHETTQAAVTVTVGGPQAADAALAGAVAVLVAVVCAGAVSVSRHRRRVRAASASEAKGE